MTTSARPNILGLVWRHAATQGRVEQASTRVLPFRDLLQNVGNEKEAARKGSHNRVRLASGRVTGAHHPSTASENVTYSV